MNENPSDTLKSLVTDHARGLIDAPSWSDVHTPEELVSVLEFHAAHAAKAGRYGENADLKAASACLEEMQEQIAEAKATVARLVDEIRDLRDQLPRYQSQPQSNRFQPVEPVRVRDRDEDDDRG